MDKHARYRAKCVSEGRCPHCGKPCAPYRECEQRRFYKKVSRVLNKAAKQGVFRKTAAATFDIADETVRINSKASGRPGDKRFLPKFACVPTEPREAVEWAQDLGAWDEAAIVKKIGEIRLAALQDFRNGKY